MPDGGPALAHAVLFDVDRPWQDSWYYHASAAALGATALLAHLPEVDAARLGVLGISWGGFLTCLVAALQPRLRCAVSIYGSGYLQESGHPEWRAHVANMSEAQRATWRRQWDVAGYLPRVTVPMLFLSGLTDHAFPLDAVVRSRALPAVPAALSLHLGLEHSMAAAWAASEAPRFIDHHLRGGPALPWLGAITRREGMLHSAVHSAQPPAQAQLLVTADSGPWEGRRWRALPARAAEGRVGAPVPDGAVAAVLTVVDALGAQAASALLKL